MRSTVSAKKTNMNCISIDHLTEAELVDLNHRIVERLRLMNQLRAHKAMLEFRIGDRVIFEPEDDVPVVGILTRYNKTSVTVITDEGYRWNVSPRFLKLVESSPAETTKVGTPLSAVLPLQKK